MSIVSQSLLVTGDADTSYGESGAHRIGYLRELPPSAICGSLLVEAARLAGLSQVFCHSIG